MVIVLLSRVRCSSTKSLTLCRDAFFALFLLYPIISPWLRRSFPFRVGWILVGCVIDGDGLPMFSDGSSTSRMVGSGVLLRVCR